MQDALGRKAIHAALRPLTNICSVGLFDFETDSALRGDVRFAVIPRAFTFDQPTGMATFVCDHLRPNSPPTTPPISPPGPPLLR
jgi:hypothetical protein